MLEKTSLHHNWPAWTKSLSPSKLSELKKSEKVHVVDGKQGVPPDNPFESIGSIYVQLYFTIPGKEEKKHELVSYISEISENDNSHEAIWSRLENYLVKNDFEKENAFVFWKSNFEWRIKTLTSRGIFTLKILNNFIENNNPSLTKLLSFFEEFEQFSNEVLFQFMENKINKEDVREILSDVGLVELSILYHNLSGKNLIQKSTQLRMK
jgi:hypothetical protein